MLHIDTVLLFVQGFLSSFAACPLLVVLRRREEVGQSSSVREALLIRVGDSIMAPLSGRPYQRWTSHKVDMNTGMY